MATLPLMALNADARRANNLGTAYFSAGRIDEAGEQFRYAYANITKEDSQTLAAILCNLGQFAAMKGQSAEAEHYFEDAIEMSQRLLGSPQSPVKQRECEISLAAAMANLGVLYRQQQRLSEAETSTRKALEVKERLYGADSPDITGVLNSLGIAQYEQKKYIEAEQTFRRSLAIREAHGPADDPVIAGTLANLSAVWISKGDLASADDALRRAMKIVEGRFGPLHTALVPILLEFAELYRAEGRFPAAEKTLVRALSISNSNAARDRLADLYRAEGRTTESKKVYEESFVPAPVTNR